MPPILNEAVPSALVCTNRSLSLQVHPFTVIVFEPEVSVAAPDGRVMLKLVDADPVTANVAAPKSPVPEGVTPEAVRLPSEAMVTVPEAAILGVIVPNARFPPFAALVSFEIVKA